jgi:hypothetical protein
MGHFKDGTWPASVSEAHEVHLFGETVDELIGVKVPAVMQLVRVMAVTGNGMQWKCSFRADITHCCITRLTSAPRAGAFGDVGESRSATDQQYTQTPVSLMITTTNLQHGIDEAHVLNLQPCAGIYGSD